MLRTIRWAAALAALLTSATAASAATIAYWRHEGVPGTSPTPQTDTILDVSGNGNHMRTFSAATAPTYVANTPAQLSTILPNTTSFDFTPNDDNYTDNKPLNNFNLNTFTIEASFNPDNLTRFHGITGRDGNTGVGGLAPVQLKLRDDTDRFQIEMVTDANQVLQVQSLAPATVDQWYNLAATFDGTRLSLYLMNPGSDQYILQGTATAAGATGLKDAPGTWTVGRGMFNGNLADWVDGQIDEVRISDTALAPSQFLFAIPEPSTIAGWCVAFAVALGAAYRGVHRRRAN